MDSSNIYDESTTKASLTASLQDTISQHAAGIQSQRAWPCCAAA
jgi:hypothetical protein